MKVLELEVDDDIFDKLKTILEVLPKNKVKIKEIYDDSCISCVTEDEQKDIEEKLSDKDCHVSSHSKIIRL